MRKLFREILYVRNGRREREISEVVLQRLGSRLNFWRSNRQVSYVLAKVEAITILATDFQDEDQPRTM